MIMKKIFTLIAAALVAVGASAQTVEKTVVLGTPSAATSTYSDADGIITITDNSTSGGGIQTGSNSYKINEVTPMKLSSSRNFAISYKEGVNIISATLYATTNSSSTGTLGTSSEDTNSYGSLPARGSASPLVADIKDATVLRGSAQWLAVIVVKYEAEAKPATAATTWDFTQSLSANDVTNLETDGTNWQYDETAKNWNNKAVLTTRNVFTELKANDVTLDYTKGLLFTRNNDSGLEAGRIRFYTENPSLYVNGSANIIKIEDLATNDVIRLRVKGGGTTARALTITNTNVTTINAETEGEGEGLKTIEVEKEMTVTSDGDVTITTGNGFYFYAITINAELPEKADVDPSTGINTVATAAAQAGAVKKYVEGKQIVIEKGGKKFNVAGAQIK